MSSLLEITSSNSKVWKRESAERIMKEVKEMYVRMDSLDYNLDFIVRLIS